MQTMKAKKYIVAGSFLLCLFMILFLSGCKKDSTTTTHNTPDLSAVPNEDWMGQLISQYGDITLGELTIPGTHISGADFYHVSNIYVSYRTQSWKISDQLDMGIRFLDLRLGFDTLDCPTGLGLYNDEFNHMFMTDDIYLNQSFQSVISSINSFLNDNQTEMVILLIRQVHSSLDLALFWGTVIEELKTGGFSDDRIVRYNPTTNTKLPLLSECKNKILLMTNQNNEGWLWFSFHWPSNTSGYSELVGNLHCHAQDMSNWNCFNEDEKSGYVNQMIDQCRNVPKSSQPENLFINFTSANDICSDRESIASLMNISTFNYMAKTATNRNPCGIMVMDFAGDSDIPVELVKLLISINFKND